MTVVPFAPAATDRILQEIAHTGGRPGQIGDWVVLATALWPDELWTLFPVAAVEPPGLVTAVIDLGGDTRPIWEVSAREERILVKSSWFDSATAVQALCWSPFTGLAAARAALRPLLRRPAP